MGKTHNLKTWPEPFEAVMSGKKRFEFRRDDRGFKVGDKLRLQEWDPSVWYSYGPRGDYTRREIVVDVTYIIHGTKFGVPDGYCVMSFEFNGPLEQGGQQR